MSKKEVERNNLICKLHEKVPGLTETEIGEIFKKPDGEPLSKQRVSKILLKGG